MVIVSVPLKEGSPFGFQLFAVPQLAFAPPPSQVVPPLAEIENAMSALQINSAAFVNGGGKPMQIGWRGVIARRIAASMPTSVQTAIIPRYYPSDVLLENS
jgi:hypothetical protein